MYTSTFNAEKRFQIEQMIMFFCYILLLGVVNFHVFHISGFSTTSCMSQQMLTSFEGRGASPSASGTTSLNLTEFFTEDADIFYFRVVDQLTQGRTHSKSLYIGRKGDRTEWRSNGVAMNKPPKTSPSSPY